MENPSDYFLLGVVLLMLAFGTLLWLIFEVRLLRSKSLTVRVTDLRKVYGEGRPGYHVLAVGDIDGIAFERWVAVGRKRYQQLSGGDQIDVHGRFFAGRARIRAPYFPKNPVLIGPVLLVILGFAVFMFTQAAR